MFFFGRSLIPKFFELLFKLPKLFNCLFHNFSPRINKFQHTPIQFVADLSIFSPFSIDIAFNHFRCLLMLFPDCVDFDKSIIQDNPENSQLFSLSCIYTIDAQKVCHQRPYFIIFVISIIL